MFHVSSGFLTSAVLKKMGMLVSAGLLSSVSSWAMPTRDLSSSADLAVPQGPQEPLAQAGPSAPSQGNEDLTERLARIETELATFREFMCPVTSLNFRQAGITDFTLLAGFKKLTYLNLSWTGHNRPHSSQRVNQSDRIRPGELQADRRSHPPARVNYS